MPTPHIDIEYIIAHNKREREWHEALDYLMFIVPIGMFVFGIMIACAVLTSDQTASFESKSSNLFASVFFFVIGYVFFYFFNKRFKSVTSFQQIRTPLLQNENYEIAKSILLGYSGKLVEGDRYLIIEPIISFFYAPEETIIVVVLDNCIMINSNVFSTGVRTFDFIKSKNVAIFIRKFNESVAKRQQF